MLKLTIKKTRGDFEKWIKSDKKYYLIIMHLIQVRLLCIM